VHDNICEVDCEGPARNGMGMQVAVKDNFPGVVELLLVLINCRRDRQQYIQCVLGVSRCCAQVICE